MPLSNIKLTFIFLFLWTCATGQKRIGIDVSTRLDNFRLTAHYQAVLKNRWLYSFGLYYGKDGRVLVRNDRSQLDKNGSVKSPFTNANLPVVDTLNTYYILDYQSSAKSIGIQIGIGYFYEFDVQHGLRINLNSKISYTKSELLGYYSSMDYTEVSRRHMNNHAVGAVSLELYHTIRLSGRTTFNYGFKIPYYYTLDKARFNPTKYKDLLHGIEPQLSLGLTYVVGKCD